MAASYLNRFLAIMRSLESELTAMFGGLSDETIAILARASADGVITADSLFAIQQSVGTAVMRRFVGRTSQGTMAPFITLPDGDVFPMSQYSRILFDHAQQVEDLIIEQQRGIVRKLTPEAFQAQLRQTPLFKPNPLAQYDKMHTWVDPNGYQLSDRIWRTAGNTRRQLDAYLDEAIRQGRGVFDPQSRGATGLARELETFLQPGRKLRVTNKPYGVDASYDAMRLARTEITRAHARASERAAALNPFVESMGVRLSGSHPKPDICDKAAAEGPWPKGEIPAEYQIPLHPHCLCTYVYVLVEDKTAVFNQLMAVTA